MKECQLCKHCYTDDVATCPNDGMPTMHTLSGPPVLEGKYHLDLRLGQGGMGVVYKARHAFLKTLHAIKIILPDLVGNDPQLVTRFRQEALAAAAVRHQNVVGVSDYGVINGNIPFLVMEYVEGESLHDLLTREKALDAERALELISAICAGVGAAHHQGIVHRDLKPLNVMICNDKPSVAQSVKILDFGLAKIKSGELLGSFIQAQTTGLMGSPYYMAPEQWADDEPDSRSDIYSIGVMLFQMLSGDVPFKGSSIPAIMKKHISDPPPSFAAVGVSMSPEIEIAVMHTLEKEPDRRTPTVEKLVEELKEAIYPPSIGIHTTSGGSLPVSSLRIRSSPGQSKIFVDSIPVGETRDAGWLLLEGIQSGNHHLRLTHDGFQDWTADLLCDGQPQQVIAELRPAAQGVETFAIPKPGEQRGSGIPAPHKSEAVTRGFRPVESDPSLQKTANQQVTTGDQDVVVRSQPAKQKKWFFSPLVLGTAAVVVLLGLGAVSLIAAYMLGFIGRPASNANLANKTTPTPAPSVSPGEAIKADLVTIPGGTFKMGNNQGRPNEQPEHDAQVPAFKMDKTEVTNAEFFEFLAATGYKPTSGEKEKFVGHWVNGRPLAGQEKTPVRFVNWDDAKAFAEWRSKRDGVTYRLPTEVEWEYAARNGSKGNLYPWGDKFDAKCAVIDGSISEPAAAGSKGCPDDWGVQDLIGNVWEWTSTDASAYPGSPVVIQPHSNPIYMIRGGSYFEKSSGPNAITSTFRADVAADRREPNIGFRLVTTQ
jgi:serine/threonine protein kinase/formylglycine-generating enzyme required for sulfatase activity